MTKATKAKAPSMRHEPADLVETQGGVLTHMALSLIHPEAFGRVAGIDVTDPMKYVAVLVDGSSVDVEADVTDPDSLPLLATAIMSAPLGAVFAREPENKLARLIREALDLNMHLRDAVSPD